MKKRGIENRDRNALHPLVIQRLLWIKNALLDAAAYLEQQTNRYPSKQKLLALAVFCFVSMALSTGIIMVSLKKKSGPAFSISRIKGPKLHKETIGVPVLTQKEKAKMHALQSYLDSLGHTQGGKVRRDSLLKSHPYLVDTINYLLKQFSNK